MSVAEKLLRCKGNLAQREFVLVPSLIHHALRRIRHIRAILAIKELRPAEQIASRNCNSHRRNDHQRNNQSNTERCFLHRFFLLHGAGCVHQRIMARCRLLCKGIADIQFIQIALHSAPNSFLSCPLARWILPRTVAIGRRSVCAISA